MPQRLNETVSNTFIQGLITERAELTFPENASIDESNCELLRTGARRRRLGLAQESGGQLSVETSSSVNSQFTVHLWYRVNEIASRDFVVVQAGNQVSFYLNATDALSGNRVTDDALNPLLINLDTYNSPTTTIGAGAKPIEVTDVKGSLIIANTEMNTIIVSQSKVDGTLTIEEISFRVRDYDWRGDTAEYATKLDTGSTSVARIYDTKNTGWADGPNDVGDSALTSYLSTNTAYPPLTHPWYSGKNSSDVFSVNEWEKIFAGTTLITNGHYLYDLYSKDRSAAAGDASLNTTETARFGTVATYASRVFYSGMRDSSDDNGSKIFFTPILEQGVTKVGDLFQINDPTSEELSDLLDTDGGFIYIPEVGTVYKLHSFGPDLYVFANNGVWRISGVDDVFRASEYSVSKLTKNGILTKESFVDAAGRPYWWSSAGIFTIGANEQGQVVPQNLSKTTIQTFYNNIGNDERGRVQGAYDDVQSRVIWAYPTLGETRRSKLNEFLVFDETLGAFAPWTISDPADDGQWVVGLAFSDGTGTDTLTFNVVDSNGNQIVDSSGNDVVVQRSGAGFFSSSVKVLYRDSTGAVSFAEFADTNFVDWGSANYSSYAETAYSFLGSSMTYKNAPYVLSFMKTTETGWTDNGDGSYTEIRGSSCLLSGKWDFRTASASAGQECYRLKYATIVDEDDLETFSYPETVVQTRLKIRGRGRAVVLRWESTAGKDFHLLGWGMLGASNDRV